MSQKHSQAQFNDFVQLGLTGYSYNESFNGKLRDELLNGEIFYTLKEAQVLIEQWRRHYNTVRPHSALGYRPPAPQTIVPHRVDPPFANADRRSPNTVRRLN
jgi:putative transposase